MSHRPWEMPSGGGAVGGASRISSIISNPTSSPPPPPPLPPSVLAGILPPNSWISTLPPLHHDSRSYSSRNSNGKRRRESECSQPPLIPTSTMPLSPHSARTPPSPRLYQSARPAVLHQPSPPQHLYNNSHGRRFQYPTASSLSNLVAQIYNVVQDLSSHLDPTPPGCPRPPPPSKISLPELPTLDDIGICLESVYTTLHTRVETISHSPQSHCSSTTPRAVAPATTTTIPHETLKNNALLTAALSRSQKRAETLEKKMISLENESEQWALDRERLMGSIEILEESVAELRSDRDDARRELRASCGQWTQIVGNAAKLEKGLWSEVCALKQGTVKCAACGGRVGRLVEANEGLGKRVEVLESLLERVRCGESEMRGLVDRLGTLSGQLDVDISGVLGASMGGGYGGGGD